MEHLCLVDQLKSHHIACFLSTLLDLRRDLYGPLGQMPTW